jgi:hypothetical protein
VVMNKAPAPFFLLVISNNKAMGWGLAPAPFCPTLNAYTLLTIKWVLNYNKWYGHVRIWSFLKDLVSQYFMGSNPRSSKTISPFKLVMGCHVATHVWATWNPFISPQLPLVNVALVPITVQSPCCLCYHMSLLPLPRVTSRECHITF